MKIQIDSMSNTKYSFIFMGVSGSGKSTVAKVVSEKLDAPLLDGDSLHPKGNIDKMSAGQALNDKDRKPWLESLNSSIHTMQQTYSISFLVCSALKKEYRNMLRKNNVGLYFIYLKGDFNTVSERLKNRKGHFFKFHLLKSQFDTLEEPSSEEKDIYILRIDQPLEDVVNQSLTFIQKVINEGKGG